MRSKSTFNRSVHDKFFQSQFNSQSKYVEIERRVELELAENQRFKDDQENQKKERQSQRLDKIINDRRETMEAVKVYKDIHSALNENFLMFRKKMAYLYTHSEIIEYFEKMK
jgi:hypothetical protein